MPQREVTFPGSTLDKIDSNLCAELRTKIVRPKNIPKLEMILRESRLTRQQQKVLRLYLFEGKSFFEIGESLGITKSSAHEHYDLALKRAQKHLTISTWLKDLGFLELLALSKNGVPATNSDPRPIDPFHFRSSSDDEFQEAPPPIQEFKT